MEEGLKMVEDKSGSEPEDLLRATGRTTRQVDGYIQWLFENRGEWIIVSDHYKHSTAEDIY